jgi:multiple sugar transport system substrate-binding protein
MRPPRAGWRTARTRGHTADPVQVAFSHAVSVARPRAYGPNYLRMSEEIMRTVHAVLGGTVTPEAAAATDIAAIEPLLTAR